MFLLFLRVYIERVDALMMLSIFLTSVSSSPDLDTIQLYTLGLRSNVPFPSLPLGPIQPPPISSNLCSPGPSPPSPLHFPYHYSNHIYFYISSQCLSSLLATIMPEVVTTSNTLCCHSKVLLLCLNMDIKQAASSD